MATAEPKAPPSYAYIDALRGWAILLVILTHAGQGRFAIRALHEARPPVTHLFLPKWLLHISQGGSNGVLIFFTLSALSLTLGMIADPAYGLRAYALRRALRIAPMYWFGIALYAVLTGFGPRVWAPDGIGGADVAANLALVHAWRPNALNSVVPGGWSIAAEAMFYVALPFAFALTRMSRAAAPILLACAFAVSFWHSKDAGRGVEQFSWFNYLPCFALGLLVADRLEWARESPIWRAFAQSRAAPVAAVALLGGVIGAEPWFIAYLHGTALASYAIGFTVLTVALPVGALCLLLHGAPHPARWIVNPAMERIVLVSFSMYVLHFALLEPAYKIAGLVWDGRDALFLVLYYGVLTATTFALATLTHRFVERPFMRWSREISRGWAARRPALAIDAGATLTS